MTHKIEITAEAARGYFVECSCGWEAVRIGYDAIIRAVEAHRESHARATH